MVVAKGAVRSIVGAFATRFPHTVYRVDKLFKHDTCVSAVTVCACIVRIGVSFLVHLRGYAVTCAHCHSVTAPHWGMPLALHCSTFCP